MRGENLPLCLLMAGKSPSKHHPMASAFGRYADLQCVNVCSVALNGPNLGLFLAVQDRGIDKLDVGFTPHARLSGRVVVEKGARIHTGLDVEY